MGIEERYFFDTYAIFSIIQGKPTYARFTNAPIKLTIFNLIELYFLLSRDFGDKKAKEIYYLFKECIVEISDELVFDSMKFKLAHRNQKLSYADCIGYFTARRQGLQFLTGDTQFQHLPNVEFVV